MKIKTENLEPNPYRNMGKYPLDKAKIASLKNSINETGWWDNLMCRPHPEMEGKFQIAYGHHRLIALRELDITSVDIPCRDLPNLTMLKMMIEENEGMYGHGNKVAIDIETVRIAIKFIKNLCRPYKTWKSWSCLPAGRQIGIDNHKAFAAVKDGDIGRTILKNFLSQNWSNWRIDQAVTAINEQEKGYNAATDLGSFKQGQTFRENIKQIDKKREEQGLPPIPADVKKELPKKIKARQEKEKEKPRGERTESRASMGTMIMQELGDDQFEAEINDAVLDIDSINQDITRLVKSLKRANRKLGDLGIDQIGNFPLTIFTTSAYSSLYNEMEQMLNRFKLTFKTATDDE